jgi:sialate O-acetylesterase
MSNTKFRNYQIPIMKNGLILISLLSTICAFANVKLPKIVGDNMILQRDANLNIWGWADKGEKVTVSFMGKTYNVQAGKDGKWSITLPPVQAGGPYEMTIKGKNEIKLKNILIGEVFLCSGQSNMGFSLKQCGIYGEEIENAYNPNIREFTVKNGTSFTELEDVTSAGWNMADSNTVKEFSAVAYFFAKEIYKLKKIPVGIINSSWGGSSIEFWMSKDAVKPFPQLINYYKKEDSIIQGRSRFEYYGQNLKAWREKGMSLDKGLKERWEANGMDLSSWNKIFAPATWESRELPDFDGIVWFKKEVDVPQTWAGKEVKLFLSTVDDMDLTWVNGTKVGETDSYAAKRNYIIPAGILKAGKNMITVKAVDYGGGGGFSGNNLFIECEGDRISLNGDWLYKVGYNFGDMQEYMYARYAWRLDWRPATVYNAMMAPIVNYQVKGMLWYQGEGNTSTQTESYEYRNWLKSFVNDYRIKWKNPNMGFLCVELANWLQPDILPVNKSNWALLRESQAEILKVPNTGIANIIDLGEVGDIHPTNKMDVGKRLAIAARRVIYGENVPQTPQYQSMQIDGNKVKITFNTFSSKLKVNDKYGYVKCFAIAGEDKKFVWAKAVLDSDNTITVSSDAISKPVYVRFAWADNPDDFNLYSIEGLPVQPFRTDK